MEWYQVLPFILGQYIQNRSCSWCGFLWTVSAIARLITIQLECHELISTSLRVFTEDQKTCDHVTGEFKCRPGYTGSMCEHPCSLKTYGQDCRNRCVCQNAADCHHVTGKWMASFFHYVALMLYFQHECERFRLLQAYANVSLDGVDRTAPSRAGTAITAWTVRRDVNVRTRANVVPVMVCVNVDLDGRARTVPKVSVCKAISGQHTQYTAVCNFCLVSSLSRRLLWWLVYGCV